MNAEQKRAAARTVRCPDCGVQPFMSCKRATRTRLIALKNPHAARIALALAAKEN